MRSCAQALYPLDIFYALYTHASPRINATTSAFSRTSSRSERLPASARCLAKFSPLSLRPMRCVISGQSGV